LQESEALARELASFQDEFDGGSSSVGNKTFVRGGIAGAANAAPNAGQVYQPSPQLASLKAQMEQQKNAKVSDVGGVLKSTFPRRSPKRRRAKSWPPSRDAARYPRPSHRSPSTRDSPTFTRSRRSSSSALLERKTANFARRMQTMRDAQRKARVKMIVDMGADAATAARLMPSADVGGDADPYSTNLFLGNLSPEVRRSID